MARRAHGLMAWLALATLAAILVSGCGPEAARSRGGRSGADFGNYPAGGRDNVQMHGDTQGPAQIYFNTPNRITSNKGGERVR